MRDPRLPASVPAWARSGSRRHRSPLHTGRAVPAVVASKTASLASRRLGRGGGTALPGLIAERIEPRIVAHLTRTLGGGSIIVTGTNGKTTTARMLADAIQRAGRRTLHNRSGSNLMRGLAASVTAAAGITGRIPNAACTTGVFEVDEATVPAAVAAIRPRAVAFTNLFRDQLDRYGEVDSITALWDRAVAGLDRDAALVLNADDPSIAALSGNTPGRVLTFGVDDAAGAAATGADAEQHPADARWCSRCGAEFRYGARFFWHVGHWSCSGCGATRPRPDVAATGLAPIEGGEGTRVRIDTPAGTLDATLPLSGLYNVYNALAATAAALAMDVPAAAIPAALASFSAAFGRQETFTVRGREVRLLLCKNPAGVNQVLHTITGGPDPAPLHVLAVLNDGIADGRDVSWIWDVDYELLAGRTATVVAAGTRAADLALRLKYAGLERALLLEPDPRVAVSRALSATPPGTRLYILPTYTAMLAVRELIARMAGGRHFWQQ